jgi:predicted esterase
MPRIPGYCPCVRLRWPKATRSLLALFRRCGAVGVSIWLIAVPASADEPKQDSWCAPELEVLANSACGYLPERATAKANEAAVPRTLILFLHSLVQARSTWQWEQQRTVLRIAKANGFAALMPRGRRGIGPGRLPDTWAWPTSATAQKEFEDELVAEWASARAELERRQEARFDRLYVFGFSNGAYYASSLALRGRLEEADGYAAFAGGAGGKYASLLGSRTSRRVPIFIGYGTRDPARNDMRKLAKTLSLLGWRHRVKAESVGHTVTESQLRHAIAYLSSPHPPDG